MTILTGHDVRRLMRRHHVTIRELAARLQRTMKRVRHVRDRGLDDTNAARDWIEAITGRDPGPLAVSEHVDIQSL